MLALIVSYSDFDLPQHLLVDFAHRRAERCHGRGGVEVKDTQKVFVFVVIAGFQSAAGHKSVCDADGSRIAELYSDVEIIILFQERIGNVVENIPLIGVPVFICELCGNSFELFPKTVFTGYVVGTFQHGADANVGVAFCNLTCFFIVPSAFRNVAE